jgi:putative Holliday junction resolvase
MMGLDVGDKWIGVALSDPGGILASPLTRIDRAGVESPLAAIRRLVSEHDVKLVVAGLPYSMDGSLGQQAERVRDFLQELSESLEVPIETRDERLSTVAASRRMIEAGAKKGSRKERIDAAAAAFILQGYLDQMSVQQGQS